VRLLGSAPRLVGVVGAVLSCLVIHTAIAAQESKRDTLYVSGRVDALDTGSTGGGGGVEWLHPLGARAGLALGAFAFSFAEAQWSYAKLGGYYFLYKDRTILSTEANVGAGTRATGDFTHQVYKVEIIQALIDKRLYGAAEEQYFHVASTEENIVKVGMIVYPVPALSARLNYHISTGGNVNSRYVSGRMDAVLKYVAVLGGFAVGRATPEQFNLITETHRSIDTQEFFAGLSIPFGQQGLTVVFDVTQQPGLRRYSTLLSWKIPF
jgi:hypothetical protein